MNAGREPITGHGSTTPSMAADPLAGVQVFAGLAPEMRAQVAAATVQRKFRRGQLLFQEGDPGNSLIMVRQGAVAVFRTAVSGERALLAVVRPPDGLGEVSLLDGAPRSTSAEALEQTVVAMLDRALFWDLVHTQPGVLDAVLSSFTELIR